MEAIGIVIGVVALFVLGLTALLAVTAVKAGRAVGRRVEERGAQARRAVEDATLKARSYARPGPQGRIAALRLEVRGSLAGTRQVLEAGIGDDPQLRDALHLLAQLEGHGRELDGELRMLEREPGAARVEARLSSLREHAERLTHAAESLRWAAQDRAHRFSDDALGRLSQECQAEASALRHWSSAQVSADAAAGGAAVGGGASGAVGAGGGAAARRAGGAFGAPAVADQRPDRQGGPQGPQGPQGGWSEPAPGRRGLDAERTLGPSETGRSLADRLRKPRPNSGPSAAG